MVYIVGQFWSFFKGKTEVMVTVSECDEWVSLLLREVPGMGNWGGDKGSLLMDSQSEENNWKWHWQDQGSMGCVWGNIN